LTVRSLTDWFFRVYILASYSSESDSKNSVAQDPIVYLNGEWLPLSEARISPLDRGFQFSDSIYEVIPVYQKRAFYLESHIDRLFRSLGRLKINLNLQTKDIRQIVDKLINLDNHFNQQIYIQISRGISPVRKHAFPSKILCPTFFSMTSLLERPSEKDIQLGLSAITLKDNRWLRCDIKSTALLANVLARQQAAEKKADEAILFRNNKLSEGAASSIWLVKNGKLYFPKKSKKILEGIRIEVISDICKTLNISITRKDLSIQDLFSADEILLTSATKEVLPITKIDKKIVDKNGIAEPGPIFKMIRREYDKLIQNHTC